jgi:Zn-dependent M28 family amino/carboxypeptidase
VPTGGPSSSSPPTTEPSEPVPSAGPDQSEPTQPDPTQQPEPARFDADAAFATVRHLADGVGPRHGTSPAFERAADWVTRQLGRYGYDVRSQYFQAPAGNSWGVDVPAGRSRNVIATPPGFDPGEPHLVVGGHLDTVPQAPGAEDNASGVAVVLELARMASEEPPRLPVVFVAFGAEEPRGEGDALHHFGSKAFVNRMDAAQRRALVAMVSLDRVGVGAGGVVPVSAGGLEPPEVRKQLVKAGNRVDVETVAELNQSSDHWSFDKAGLPAARVGSTPYAAYHSAADVPSVVNPAQLKRVGTLMWEWVQSS